MIPTTLYVLLGLAVICLAWALVHRPVAAQDRPREIDEGGFPGFWEAPRLRIAERIFDSADYHWLRHEVARPELARDLARVRKAIALRWLKAVRVSFEDLIRTPDPMGRQSASSAKSADSRIGRPQGSPLLWRSLRFQILLGYATLVVRLFGPYHRLIWSLDFLPGRAADLRKEPQT